MADRRARCAARTLTAGVVVLALSSGCGETSRIDPDATVTIAGEMRAVDGTPLRDHPVRLASGVGGSDAALAVVTLGLACTAGICQDQVSTGQTDGGGGYRVQVEGRATQTAFGNVRPQVLSVSAAPRGKEISGASISARFVVQTPDLLLPSLQLVDPGLSVRGSGPGIVEASWAASSGGPYTLTFESDSVLPVWEVPTGGASTTVDSRVLEDTQGRVVLAGGYTDTVQGSDLNVRWRSPGTGYAAGAGAPLSRARPCRYSGSSPQEQGADSACALTDGDLFSAEPLSLDCPVPTTNVGSAPPCSRSGTVVIDLSSAVPAELVVVRGCDGGCPVEVSSDGITFRAAGSVTAAFDTLRLPGTPVRAVRVGLGSAGLREVSVWGPPGQEPGLRALPEASIEELRVPFGVDSRLPRPVVALAALLAATAVLGVGYLLGGRRRRGPVRRDRGALLLRGRPPDSRRCEDRLVVLTLHVSVCFDRPDQRRARRGRSVRTARPRPSACTTVSNVSAAATSGG